MITQAAAGAADRRMTWVDAATRDNAPGVNIMYPVPSGTQARGQALVIVAARRVTSTRRKGGKDVQNENFPLRCTIR
jgi:hypothetical protein